MNDPVQEIPKDFLEKKLTKDESRAMFASVVTAVFMTGGLGVGAVYLIFSLTDKVPDLAGGIFWVVVGIISWILFRISCQKPTMVARFLRRFSKGQVEEKV
jgi:hypothetical protein